MPDHPHTIDRRDEATGENLFERIAGVSNYTVALETYRAAVERCLTQKSRAQPGAGHGAERGSWNQHRVNACVASSRVASKP
jgi:hypothetical protein